MLGGIQVRAFLRRVVLDGFRQEQAALVPTMMSRRYVEQMRDKDICYYIIQMEEIGKTFQDRECAVIKNRRAALTLFPWESVGPFGLALGVGADETGGGAADGDSLDVSINLRPLDKNGNNEARILFIYLFTCLICSEGFDVRCCVGLQLSCAFVQSVMVPAFVISTRTDGRRQGLICGRCR